MNLLDTLNLDGAHKSFAAAGGVTEEHLERLRPALKDWLDIIDIHIMSLSLKEPGRIPVTPLDMPRRVAKTIDENLPDLSYAGKVILWTMMLEQLTDFGESRIRKQQVEKFLDKSGIGDLIKTMMAVRKKPPTAPPSPNSN